MGKFFEIVSILIRYLFLYVVLALIQSIISDSLLIEYKHHISILFSLVSIFIIFFIARFFDTLKRLNTNILSSEIVLCYAIISLSSILLIFFISWIGQGFSISGEFNRDQKFLLLQVALYFGLLGGLKEEFFFRGIYFKLIEEKTNALWSLALTTILFTLIHTGVNLFSIYSLFIFSLGFLCGTLRLVTGNVWISVIFHFLWNFTTTLVSGTDEISPLHNFLSKASSFYTDVIPAIIFLLLSLTLLIMKKYVSRR
ncbi:MAG: lysostaphin resistance A-like protein [Chryseotalea sp.]